MTPDWEISARSPAFRHARGKAGVEADVGIMMPRQFGPISRKPYFCAARSAASADDPGP